jgi:hypothetical protein
VRILVTGWFSFLHGEATAGDLLALEAVLAALPEPYDVAWSPVLRPDGPSLADCPAERYTHLVFVCGPLHGPQIVELHERYSVCVRIAVGVSVLDPADPAVTGFHQVLARDGCGPAAPDLATATTPGSLPVAGVVLTSGQGEYGERRRHEQVTDAITGWLAERECALLPLDTRLDPRDWRTGGDPRAFGSIVRRLDLVVTTRLHGLVLALRAGVPALAVDPVAGGGKVTAQARVLDWPAVVPAAGVLGSPDALAAWWKWCLSPEGRAAAAGHRSLPQNPLLSRLESVLRE